MATTEVSAGLVERVTFYNEANGFCVPRVKARGQRHLITALGHAAAISADERHCGLPAKEFVCLMRKLLEVAAEHIETGLGVELEDGILIAGDLEGGEGSCKEPQAGNRGHGPLHGAEDEKEGLPPQQDQASVRRLSAPRAPAHTKTKETRQSGSTPAQVRRTWRSCLPGIQSTSACL